VRAGMGGPTLGVETQPIPRVTGTAFSPAMVGGRLQAFWKHGVQVWAPGSDQVSPSLPKSD
jgi:mitogen-activated protein kinase kinase kinase kinase 1